MRILLIGASGAFGSRLARMLAREAGMALVLAGRRREPLEAMAEDLGSEAAVLDRNALTADALRAMNVTLVIDASGPFQLMDGKLINVCIQAGVHYVDLADGRDFVAGISRYHAAALAADVLVLTGASSTPALSHAVIDALTTGWRRIDMVRIAISPSNRQPRGRAVVEAILGGIGQPLRLFQLGRWRQARGWGGLRRIDLPHVGRRWASLCDTPDLDLLVSRYRPTVAAEFFASLELSIMHLGLAALARLVRFRLMRTLLPLTRPLIWMANRLQPFGNDKGGMIVDVNGQDAAGSPVHSRWWLAAKGDAGPNVPVLAALNVARMLREGTLAFRGATACVGLVPLSAFDGDLPRWESARGAKPCRWHNHCLSARWEQRLMPFLLPRNPFIFPIRWQCGAEKARRNTGKTPSLARLPECSHSRAPTDPYRLMW